LVSTTVLELSANAGGAPPILLLADNLLELLLEIPMKETPVLRSKLTPLFRSKLTPVFRSKLTPAFLV